MIIELVLVQVCEGMMQHDGDPAGARRGEIVTVRIMTDEDPTFADLDDAQMRPPEIKRL